MKEWEPFFAVLAVAIFIAHSISDLGKALGKRLDELHGKADALQEKLEEVEQKIEDIEGKIPRQRSVNPIDP
jgi:prefoldin subunit 5